jgi:integrase
MKKTWPRIKKTINHGIKVYLVDARINGGGERRFYATREEAVSFAENERSKRLVEGTGAIINAELTSFGWSVHQAIDHALKYLRSCHATLSLAEALTKFLDAKRAERLSPERVSELERAVNRLIACYPDHQVGDIKTKDINAFLRGLDRHNTTRMNYRRDLHTFFEWCAVEELIEEDRVNPVARALSFDSESERETISPQQFERLLLAAEDIIRPAFVLGGFCAVRQAEIARLDWRDIDLKERVITISAQVAKGDTGRRTVTIPAPAIAWLTPLAKKVGPVLPPRPPREKGRGRKEGKFIQTPVAKRYQEAREAWDMARLHAGFGPFATALAKVRNYQVELSDEERAALVPWPENCLRHSAISNRLALAKAPEAAAKAFGVKPDQAAAFVSMEAVAEDAGNSRTTIKQHYDALSKPNTARKWFAIMPPKDGKVIPYPRAA